jgi:Ca2+-binding RTX toxin-like protein
MILGVLIGFAALAALSSVIGDGESGTYDPVTDEGGLNVTGSDQDDLLSGSAGDDQFFGRGGNDLIIGDDGDDALFGGADDDLLRGGGGGDLIFDTEGSDRLMGDTGDDLIVASAVVEQDAVVDLVANTDPDQPGRVDLTELAMNLRADVDAEGDVISGGYGNDTILAGSGDTITTGEGLDNLILGAWIGDDGPVTVTDFSTDEDTLVFAYDQAGDAPEMTLDYTEDPDGDPLDALLYANAQLVAIVEGTGASFTLDDVILTPVRATT